MYTGFNEHNITPYNAKKIGVYNEDGKKVGYINLPKQNFDERLYRVGLMSDTHYNDYDIDDDPDINTSYEDTQFESDFVNALEYYDKKEDVEFVCVSGDVSTDSIQHILNFRAKRDRYAPNTPVYSCKGNHDNAASYDNNEIWKECVSTYNDDKTIIYCPYGDGTSFYFEKNIGDSKDIFIFLNVDYGNSETGASSNETDSYIEDSERTHQYYHPEVIEWFASILEQFKNDRCFVFTHLFFRQKAGNNHGELYKYYSNGRSRLYNLRGTQFLRLNELNNKYKNSIWFSGHSHYQWAYQEQDKIINVCNYDSYFTEGSDENGIGVGSIEMGEKKCDSAYNVHLPSLARPLKLDYGYAVDHKRSEGAIIDVYKDYVDIRGIVFKDQDSAEITPTSFYINSDIIIPDYSRPQYTENQIVEQLDNDYIRLTFDNWQMFYISAYYDSQIELEIEDIKVYDSNGNDLTQLMKDSYYFGFRTTIWDDKHGHGEYIMYFMEDNIYGYDGSVLDKNEQGIRFGISSAFEHFGENNPIVFENGYKIYCEMKVKMNTQQVKEYYKNKYSPIATYRLYVGGSNNKKID